jgi:hypothetical protein
MAWTGVVRYLLIAIAAFVIGIAINLTIGPRLGGQDFFNPGLILLLVWYGFFHVVAVSVARILSTIFPIPVCSILYLSLATTGFLAAIYLLNPSKYGGIHLFVICWGSLVLVALDYFVRQRSSDRLSLS